MVYFQETGQIWKHSRDEVQEEEQEKTIALVLETGARCQVLSRCVEMSNGSLETLGWSSAERRG